jgi:hypothetical protein
MILHSYAINSAHVDRLYSGNNCLESIKKQNHIIDGHEGDTYNLSPYPRPFCGPGSKPQELF